MFLRAIAGAGIVVVLAGACGSQNDSTSGTVSETPTSVAPSITEPSASASVSSSEDGAVDALARQIGCTDVREIPPTEIFVASIHQCDVADGIAAIYTFATPQDEQDWLEPAIAVAGEDNVFVIDATHVVTGTDAGVSKELQKVLG